MAHVTHFKLNGAVAILRHNERTPNDKVVSRKNECIEPSRTHLNYTLDNGGIGYRGKDLKAYIERLCASYGVTVNKRKDLNIMSSWVITAPKDLQESEYKRFFECANQFLRKRYLLPPISSVVHMDETRPHLHYGFVPVWVNKKGEFVVSSKNCLNRKELLTFHKDLSKAVEKEFGRKLAIENGITKELGGNKSIEELKKGKTLEFEIKKLEKNIEELTTQLDVLSNEFKTRSVEVDNEMDKFREKYTNVPVIKKAFSKDEFVPKKYYDELFKIVWDARKIECIYENSKRNYESVKNLVDVKANKEKIRFLESENKILKDRNKILKNDLYNAEADQKKLWNIEYKISEMPSQVQDLFYECLGYNTRCKKNISKNEKDYDLEL